MKRIFVVTLTTTVLLFSIFGLLGLAARGGPEPTPAEASPTPADTPVPAKQVEAISGPVSPLTGDLPDRLDTAGQPLPALESVSLGDPRAGERLFALACGKCHGRKRDGSLDLSSNVSKPDFTNESADQELFVMIKTGRATDGTQLMPPKGGNPALTDENLDDIVAFIRSLDQ